MTQVRPFLSLSILGLRAGAAGRRAIVIPTTPSHRSPRGNCPIPGTAGLWATVREKHRRQARPRGPAASASTAAAAERRAEPTLAGMPAAAERTAPGGSGLMPWSPLWEMGMGSAQPGRGRWPRSGKRRPASGLHAAAMTVVTPAGTDRNVCRREGLRGACASRLRREESRAHGLATRGTRARPGPRAGSSAIKTQPSAAHTARTSHTRLQQTPAVHALLQGATQPLHGSRA